MSFTNKDGIRIDLSITPHIAQKINEIIAHLLEGVPPSYHSNIKYVQEQALTAIANRSILQLINQSLVSKQQQIRQGGTKKTFGEARILTVKDAQEKRDLKEQKLEEERKRKERYHALRGVIGFVKKTWKELPIDFDIFSYETKE
jgi:hypothetical protein